MCGDPLGTDRGVHGEPAGTDTGVHRDPVGTDMGVRGRVENSTAIVLLIGTGRVSLLVQSSCWK